jgi:hypothetical protein
MSIDFSKVRVGDVATFRAKVIAVNPQDIYRPIIVSLPNDGGDWRICVEDVDSIEHRALCVGDTARSTSGMCEGKIVHITSKGTAVLECYGESIATWPLSDLVRA